MMEQICGIIFEFQNYIRSKNRNLRAGLPFY